MKRTGELLKTARENAKLSLSEVALSTKINPKVLAAIENGDSANLPAKTFLKGFVRSYAMFLKMDADQVMRSFNEEMSGAAPAPQPVAAASETARPAETRAAPAAETPAPAPKQRRVGDDEHFSGLRAVAVVVIVVLIGLIIGVRELIEKYQREKVVETAADVKVSPLPETPAPPKPEIKAELKVEAKPAEVKPADTKPAEEPPKALAEAKPAEPVKKEEPVAPPAPVPPTPSPIAVTPPPAPAVPVPSPVVVAKAPDVKPPEAKPTESKPAEAKPAEAKPADAKPADPAKPESAIKNVKNEIILEALDKVEVKFKIRGQNKVLSLGPTQVHTILADEPISLDLSDGGAVNIILNGRERGVPGDLGKPKQVNLP